MIIDNNVYNKLLYMGINDAPSDSMLTINLLFNEAYISTNNFSFQYFNIIDNIKKIEIKNSDKYRNKLICLILTNVGMDVDGDVIKYSDWIEIRDKYINKYNKYIIYNLYRMIDILFYKAKCLLDCYLERM